MLIIPIYAKASINKILILVRIRIFELSVQEQLQSDPLVGQIKVDESYFGARRVKGRRGMVPEVKQLYLAYSKRGDKVYTQIIEKCDRNTLQTMANSTHKYNTSI